MLIDTLRAGGAERIAAELSAGLDRSRFAPSMIVTRFGGPLEDTLKDGGVPYTILGRKHGFAPSKFLRARRLVRDADLVHAHGFGSSLWSVLLLIGTATPLVTRDPTFDGRPSLARTTGYRYLIGRRAQRIICPSLPVADSIRREGVKPEIVQVIVNGVQLDAALPRVEARRELGLPDEAFVVGIIALLREEKAHEVLLEAVARLRRRQRQVLLCIVGAGSRLKELQALASSLGIEQDVVWAGLRKDAKRLASAFDVGVICSDWEGLPVASLETLAAGVPMIATRVGVLPEIIGDAGIIVPPRDDERLAAAIETLLDDPTTAIAMGRRGRQRAQREFSFPRMVTEYERLYDELIGTNDRQSARPRGSSEARSSAPDSVER
jgi:glycosyltransferase involved in cell wall biosynthesis